MGKEDTLRHNEPAGAQDIARQRQLLSLAHQRLGQEYGFPASTGPSNPTEELVRTILSQNTNDVNRDRAFNQLRQRFPTWHKVATAPTHELAEAIRPGGLADIKAPRIQHALSEIGRMSGDYDLSFICRVDTQEALRWLTSLPGVGPKTAACVLLFACEKPVMPVDTHILRVLTRLGLWPEGTSAEKAHVLLATLVEPEHVYPLHINLIRHGRQVCKPREPRTSECILRDLCHFAAWQNTTHQ